MSLVLMAAADAAHAAAEHVSETSKTPFYLVGGALAVWAVFISVVAMTRPELTQKAAGARAVMLITAVLVAGSMATAVVTA